MSDFEMDIDEDSDEEDTQTQLKELEQLRAVLHEEQDSCSERTAESCPSVSNDPITNQMTDDLSKIEMAIALNKFTDEKLQRLETLLIAKLHECKEKLKSLQSPDFLEPQEKANQFKYVICGKPYFKDKCYYPAPPNDDTILMAKSEMYDFTSIPSVPGWTVKDKTNFISIILKMSQNIRVKELNSKIAHLKRQANSKKIRDDIDNEIEKLLMQIECVNKTPLKDLALPLTEEYDWDTVANKLNHRHSAHEYRALWKLFLHPSINKSGWSKTEHNLLQKLATSYHQQDWDQIAKELNTRRTGYQCFVYYRTNMSDTFDGQKWSKEEEEYLKRLVDFFREDNYIPWGRVAASMENRTKVQVYNKFIRIEEHRKGRFIPEEDAVILSAVEHLGVNDFRKIQQYLPGRSVIQLRNRYHVLSKNRVSTVWSVEEDKKLVQFLANQECNLSNYSKICQYFPGKDRAHLRARHKVLLKWIKRYPNLDISLAPRRGSRRLGHGQAAKDLNNALENLKNRIENEVKEKKSKTVSERSSEHEIEDSIVAALVTEALKKEVNKRRKAIYDDYDCEEDSEPEESCSFPTSESENKTNLEKLLTLLRCKLNRHRFMESNQFRQHFGLIGTKANTAKVVKCYSRKKQTNVVKTIESEREPDLWGNNILGEQEYVLPPHLATITGCRTIMSYVKDYADPSLNTYIQTNKKKYKNEFKTLMERFSFLFLWPILLSNESPDNYIEQMRNPQEDRIERTEAPRRADVSEGIPSSITIPPVTEDCESPSVSNDIDLPLNDSKKNENLVKLKTYFN